LYDFREKEGKEGGGGEGRGGGGELDGRKDADDERGQEELRRGLG
jgi:hypothetical protein